ncbi:MAG: NADH-quinone oxidoreductase subunit NuoH [Acidobacteriota bacterium]
MNAYWPIVVPALIKIVVILGIVLTGVAYSTLAERKVSAWMQDRRGPNRVGPFGLLQPVADGMKFFFKEDITPREAYRPLYLLAPFLTLFPALITFAVIPFGTQISVGGQTYPLIIAPGMDVGVIFLLAVSSIGVYGILLAGWSSGNKYSLMGGLRSASQVISYELGIALAVMSVVLWTGSFDFRRIVEDQTGWGHFWFVGPQFLAFIVFTVAVFAETNRLPFDLPEGESELVAGYHTEYSGLRFAMFFMGEYANMITASAFVVLLFLGGWNLPFVNYAWFGPLWGGLLSAVVFFAKVAVLLFVFIWVRWTLPRFRYDQLMSLGWKRLFPLALLNLVLISTLLVLRGRP